MASITSNVHHDVYPAIDPSGALKGSVKGKTVLVTGAGRGIGKAIGLAFSLAGATTVVLTARSESELSEAQSEILAKVQAQGDAAPQVLTYSIDVTSEKAVEGLFEMLAARNVVVDVLVNNAGTSDPLASVHESDPSVWWNTWEVNVKGVYLPTHFLLKRRFASATPPSAELTVIFTSSVGSCMIIPGMSAYQPGKTAVNRFAEYVHAEYASRGVRVFAFHPGAILTKLGEGFPSELRHFFVDTVSLAGGFAVWLAGPDADAFKGKYVDATWDVDEMVRIAAEKKKAEDEGAYARWLTTTVVF